MKHFALSLGVLCAGIGTGCASATPEETSDSVGQTSEALVAFPASKLVQPGDRYGGLDYAEWRNNYWRWFLETPWTGHPLNDGPCSAGQAGPVWFLGGTSEPQHIATRSCTVPRDVALMINIGGAECSSTTNDHTTSDGSEFGTNSNELRKCAYFWETESPTVVWNIDIDGRRIRNPEKWLGESPPIRFDLPDDNIFKNGWGEPGAVAGTYTSVEVGRAAIILPLDPGPHVIHMHCEFGDGAVRDETYNITVTP